MFPNEVPLEAQTLVAHVATCAGYTQLTLTLPLTMLLALGYFFVSKMKLLKPVDHPESMSTAPTWWWQREQ